MNETEFIIDLELANKIGILRHSAHKYNHTKRFFNDPNTEDIIGVSAEIAFVMYSGLNTKFLTFDGRGDGHIDFSFSLNGFNITIDVKGFRKPYNLLIKSKEIKKGSDIFVLSGVNGNKVWFIGWEHKNIMMNSPEKDFGYGLMSHYRHSSLLQPMWKLKKLIDKRDIK